MSENLPQLIMRIDDISFAKKPVIKDGFSVVTHSETKEKVWEEIIFDAFNTHYDFSVAKVFKGFKNEHLFYIKKGEEYIATIGATHKGGADTDGWFHMVGVKKSARGLGVGKMLGEIALYSLKEQGYKSAMLSTDDFRIPAIKLYLALGFKPIFTHESHSERWAKIYEILQIK